MGGHIWLLGPVGAAVTFFSRLTLFWFLGTSLGTLELRKWKEIRQSQSLLSKWTQLRYKAEPSHYAGQRGQRGPEPLSSVFGLILSKLSES